MPLTFSLVYVCLIYNNINVIKNIFFLFRHFKKRQLIDPTALHITGLRLEASDHEIHYSDDGVPSVLSKSEITIRIFGTNITKDTVIAFTAETNSYGGSCLLPSTQLFTPEEGTATGTTALYKVSLPKIPKNFEAFFICAKTEANIKQVCNI